MNNKGKIRIGMILLGIFLIFLALASYPIFSHELDESQTEKPNIIDVYNNSVNSTENGLYSKEEAPLNNEIDDAFKPETMYANIRDNGDGTKTAEVFATPINYYDSIHGIWKPINTSIVKKNGIYGVETGLYNAKFFDDHIETNTNTTTIEIYLLNTSLGKDEFSLDVKKNKATYDGTKYDLEYIYTNVALKQNIILFEKPEIEEKYFVYSSKIVLNHNNITAYVNGKRMPDEFETNNSVYFMTDAEDSLLFVLPKPYSFEINGTKRILSKYSIKIKNNEIYYNVSCPMDWLSSDIKYPVIIDASSTEYADSDEVVWVTSQHSANYESGSYANTAVDDTSYWCTGYADAYAGESTNRWYSVLGFEVGSLNINQLTEVSFTWKGYAGGWQSACTPGTADDPECTYNAVCRNSYIRFYDWTASAWDPVGSAYTLGTSWDTVIQTITRTSTSPEQSWLQPDGTTIKVAFEQYETGMEQYYETIIATDYAKLDITYTSCTDNGGSCSVDGDCCSGNCQSDYDAGSFCCDATQCAHDGTCYNSEQESGSYKCDSGTWKKKNGVSCSADSDCYGGYCCNNMCQDIPCQTGKIWKSDNPFKPAGVHADERLCLIECLASGYSGGYVWKDECVCHKSSVLSSNASVSPASGMSTDTFTFNTTVISSSVNALLYILTSSIVPFQNSEAPL